MDIKSLSEEGRRIWGEEKLSLAQIIVRLGKIFGDLCRFERDAPKDKNFHTKAELKKELGNMIFSSVRFCDDLGFDPEECIQEAIRCQREFEKEE